MKPPRLFSLCGVVDDFALRQRLLQLDNLVCDKIRVNHKIKLLRLLEPFEILHGTDIGKQVVIKIKLRHLLQVRLGKLACGFIDLPPNRRLNRHVIYHHMSLVVWIKKRF